MVPRTILRQLARLRRRERGLRLVWGATRWLTLAGSILAVACMVDWFIDRRQETPWEVRRAMLLVQAVLWVVAGIGLLLRPLIIRLSNSQMALWAEDKDSRLGHRLISAVQLNRVDAPTEGMSPELIGVVTREAEEQAATIPFARLADHRRLKWSAALFMPFVVVVAFLFVLFPATFQALVARQFLADREIPRSVALESVHPQLVLPSGEEVALHFRVKGDALDRNVQGEVRIASVGQAGARFPLVFEAENGPVEAIYVAHVPPADVDFTYHAMLRDGRTHQPAQVHFEPQPAIIEQRAWVVLPAYVGLRPDGKPFEQEQPRGDIVGVKNATARVEIKIQKPVVHASLEFLAQPNSPAEMGPASNPFPEIVVRRLNLDLQDGGTRAEGVFKFAELKANENAYRIVVEDQYGFRNADPARRSIRIATEELPQVNLLAEQFPGKGYGGPAEDFEVEGIPIPLGATMRIGYVCSTPLGLGRAQLRYRVNEGNWWPLPLSEVQAKPQAGAFDLRQGAFENSSEEDQVQFYAIPSPDPARILGRTDGGGRFDFQTKKIPNLKAGDRIEFCVEVYDRNPDPDRPPGRSEERIKTVVTLPEFQAWLDQTLQPKSRIQQLEAKQRNVFGHSAPSEREPSEEVAGTSETTNPSPIPEKEVAQSSFIRNWQLLGPFPSFNNQGNQTVYPPEAEEVNLTREYPLIKNNIRWQAYQSPVDFIDLGKFFNHRQAGVAYAACWIYSTKERPITMRIGSDDGIKIWLNHHLAFTHQISRSAAPGQDNASARLQPGWNELLVKVDNTDSEWGFYLELIDPATNQPPEDIAYRTIRPGKEKPVETVSSFVRNWQLVGPFASPEKRGLDTVYPPEADRTDLGREFDGIQGKIRWHLHQSETDKIDLEKFFNHSEAGVAYGLCWVRSEGHKQAVLATGSDDGIKVWINRKVVLVERASREAVAGEDKTPVDLESGWNELLVKVDNRVGTWAFYFELRDPDSDKPLPGVEYRTYLPGQEAEKFVRDWQLLGPFPNPNGQSHDVAYPPEKDPVQLTREYDGIGGKVHWRLHHSEDGRIGFDKFFNRPYEESNLAYAACWVHSNRPMPAVLATGSDDGIKVWINRRLTLDKPVHREATPGEDTQPIELLAGWNEFLVKVDNNFGRWAFFLELRDSATGGPLQGVEFTTTPPIEASPSPVGKVENYIRSWQLIGPFSNPGGHGQSVHEPEVDKVNLDGEYNGLKGKVRWKPQNADSNYVDLAKFFGFRESGIAYAVCWVHADRPKPILLKIGSNDGIKIWINRQTLFDHDIGRSAAPGQDSTKGNLAAGWNELLVKVDNHQNDWGFYLDIRDPAGQVLDGIAWQISPPGEVKKEVGGRNFLRTWQLLGPFPNPDRSGRFFYPPESDKLDLTKEYDGLQGKVRWKPYNSAQDYIDLAETYHLRDPAIAYAVCWVHSDRPQVASLGIGSNDGIKVWINRKPVFTHEIFRAAAPNQDSARVDLKSGWNEIFVKNDNQGGGWGVYLEFQDVATGKPLEGIAIRGTPPEEKKK